jgi:hypothetical protein
MKLDAWLRQDRSLGERLRLVECLCQAVNAVHDRGEALAALEPSKVEVAGDGRCDLAAARKGAPSRDYLAPDRQESGEPSALADVYAAGAISWEVLVGRAPGPTPGHLAEVRPEVPREVADAVMACLERSPDWRPKDLTYLAQIAAAKQPAPVRGSTVSRGAGGRTARLSRGGRAARSGDRPVRRTWPLLVALVVVLALAAVAAWQYLGPGRWPGAKTQVARARPAPTPTVAPVATPPSTPAPTVAPAANPGLVPTSTPAARPATPAPTPSVDLRTPPEPRATPTPLSVKPAPPPAAREVAPLAPTPAMPTPTPRPPTPTPRPPATAPGGDASPSSLASIPAAPGPPADLTTVSPLTVPRPGKALLDIRGNALRPEHHVLVVALKKAPSGISVVRQKLQGDALITVLLNLDASVSPGEYGLAVEDARGVRSNTLIFTVTK